MSESKTIWIQRGLQDFSGGHFDDGGSNLYVNAKGAIETIHRTDLDGDGHVDIFLPNGHGYIERGPTSIYKQPTNAQDQFNGKKWQREQLPNDSSWKSRVIDVDGDGHPDLIVVNAENGVTSELTSYIYWGGPEGLTGQCTEFATAGAYDVEAVDLTGNGCLDIIFPSAWVDHHNPGLARPIDVYHQTAPRKFENVTDEYGLTGIAATAVACADLNGNGKLDLVVANYRDQFEYDIDAFIYWGVDGGKFDANHPHKLPTHYAMQVLLRDLDGDGRPEIIFTGGDHVYIYWNHNGAFGPEHRTIINTTGFSTMFCIGAIRAEVADVDNDGKSELLLATEQGVEIRHTDDLQKVVKLLPLPYSTWVHAADLDADGRPEIIASKYDDRVTYEVESAIFWNSPDGFSPDRVTLLATGGPMGCTTGDVDGDGKPEVIFNNTMAGPSQFWDKLPCYVYHGSKDCDYGSHRRSELPVTHGSCCYCAADVDLDGHVDLIVTSGEGIRIFQGGADGLRADRYYDVNPEMTGVLQQILLADFNRDGYLDILMPLQTYDEKPETMARSTQILWGGPEGFSADRSTHIPTFAYGQGHLADLNGNGYLDFLTGNKNGFLNIYHGGPEGFSDDRMSRIDIGLPHIGTINSADLTGNGYLDIVVGIAGHYRRLPNTCFIFWGGPDGYSMDRKQQYDGGFTTGRITIADYDNDGELELLIPAYSTNLTRELPIMLVHRNGNAYDFENAVRIHCESAFHILPLDLSRNGYLDLVIANHRNNLGHQVDSKIFWNGPEGISTKHTTPLFGMGPHWLTMRDFGNAHTREPLERYISAPFALENRVPTTLGWDADVPDTTALKFQLRWAPSEDQLEDAPWQGPDGHDSFYEQPGQPIKAAPASAKWLQYRATFVSMYGISSPQLRQVQVGLS